MTKPSFDEYSNEVIFNQTSVWATCSTVTSAHTLVCSRASSVTGLQYLLEDAPLDDLFCPLLVAELDKSLVENAGPDFTAASFFTWGDDLMAATERLGGF